MAVFVALTLPVLVVATFAGCNTLYTDPDTGETVVDLGTFQTEVELAALDFRGAAALGDEDQARALEGVADALDDVAMAVDLVRQGADSDTVDLRGALRAAFMSLDEIVPVFTDDPETQRRMQFYVFVAQSVLRRIETYTTPAV